MQLSRELVGRYDLIVVMEVGQFEGLRRTYPEAASRIVLLSLFDPQSRQGYERYHIADPFMQARPVFEACFRRIDRAVDGLIEHINRHDPSVGSDHPVHPPSPGGDQ